MPDLPRVVAPAEFRGLIAMSAANVPSAGDAQERSTPFRFYDNRQKYLAFVNTCNEKSAIARRAADELRHIKPTPPALRIFDAGMGDGTVLAGLMRATHRLARSNAYTSGRRFVSLPARGHPGPDPRFDARDWYATTSPSSERAGLRLPAFADWPFDVMLTSVVVRAKTSKMYTS